MNISVLQWNVWYKEDIRRVAEFLEAHPADVICLQELILNSPKQTVKDTPAYVAEQLGYNYHYQELPLESTDGQALSMANGIFSRFPIVNKKYSWINQPKNSGGYDDEYRAYVEVTLDIEGAKVHIGTTHMSYTHRFEGTPNKQLETDKLLEELAKHDESFIFTGDLNAVPGSDTIKSIEQLLQNAGPGPEEKSWTTKPFSYNGFEETDLNWRLDYIFTTKDIQAVSSEILPTQVSDHLPILSKLSLN